MRQAPSAEPKVTSYGTKPAPPGKATKKDQDMPAKTSAMRN